MAGPQGAIASSVFTTGAEDVVPVVDVYGNTSDQPTNAQPNPPSNTINALNSAVTKSAPNTIITPPAATGTPVTAAAASSTVQSTTGVSAGTVSDLGTKLKNAVLTAGGLAAIGTGLPGAFKTGGIPGVLAAAGPAMSEVPGLKMVYDSVSTVIDSVDLGTANGLSAFMNTFASSDISSVFDLKSKFAVMGTLLQNATGLQIPGVLDQIINQFDASDIPNFLSGQLLGALENAALDLLAKIVSHIPSHIILAIVPQAVNILLSAYALPKGVTYPTTQMKNALVNLLVAIDPNWMAYTRNGNVVTSLAPFQAASDHALAVLELPLSSPPSDDDNAMLEACLIGRNYAPHRFVAMATSCFPGAAINPPQTSTQPKNSLGLPQLSLPTVPGLPKLQFNF